MARCIEVPLAIGLSGTLGAGKTQWTRFFADACGLTNQDATSPTFMLVHAYSTRPKIYHLDAYRIGDEDELLELGIDEMFDEEAVTIIEWADRFPNLLPRHSLQMNIDLTNEVEGRIVTIEAVGKRAKDTLVRLKTTLQRSAESKMS
jgi:tRNA threonylcarbamoyladenosine biosynthesis protein TsaE